MSQTVADLLGEPSDRTMEPPEVSDERPTCSEPGCTDLCRKRRGAEGWLPYCAPHNAMHGGGSGAPKSRGPAALEANRKASAKKVENTVTGWLGIFQRGLVANGDFYCGKVIGEEGAAFAAAAGDVASEFPWLVKSIEAGDKYLALGTLIVAGSKIGLAMAVHHGVVPYTGVIKFLVPPLPTVATPEPYTVVPQPGTPGTTYGAPTTAGVA